MTRVGVDAPAYTPLLGDAHTHLDKYSVYELPGILERSKEAGVNIIVCAGTTVESSRVCIRLADQYDSIYAGIGIHPMDAYEPLGEHAWIEMETMARSSRRVVCISEIGLDFLPTSPNHDIQIQVFREQIRLARNVKLPIVIHSRESYLEVLQILREEKAGQVGGAMHYFQGDETIAWMAIELGFYISLARPLLRLPELQEVAKAIPMKHIVLETDAAPQPFKKYRHNWTEPRHVLDVARCLAVLKGITLDEVAEATTGNLAQLLGMERLARPGCH